MSVSKLSEEMSRFEKLVRSHYTYLLACSQNESQNGHMPEAPGRDGEAEEEGSSTRQNGAPLSSLSRGEAKRELQRLHYWGAEGDLQHAGLLGALKATLTARCESPLSGHSEVSGNGRRPELSEEQIEANFALLEESKSKVEEDGGPLSPTMMVHPKAPGTQKRLKLEARL